MSATIEAERNEALLTWYAAHRRDLPWRDAPNAYAVLVSEVMLQQTQAERVIGHYRRFMQAFPTVEDLAAAPFAAVARQWSGLGYNVRAKRLHEAAMQIVAQGWPRDPQALESLPGVGPYTARAIAAFAFGVKVPAVDTNLRRVLTRWYGEVMTEGQLALAADAALGDADAADWNQALMDLGALCCRPAHPKCDECPVAAWCSGPDAYTPPRPQARFEGSFRQVRGALMRRLVRGGASFEELVTTTGFSAATVGEALDALEADGLISPSDAGYDLAD